MLSMLKLLTSLTIAQFVVLITVAKISYKILDALFENLFISFLVSKPKKNKMNDLPK